MELSRVERDVRRIPGVLACQVTGGEVHVLVAPDADADVVAAAVRDVLTLAAASPTAVRVLGGRAPIVPMRRLHGRRAIAALSASAAALAAAGVAAAVTGTFGAGARPRPTLGSSEQAVSPPATVSGLGDPETGSAPVRQSPGRAPSTSTTTTAVPRPESDVQPERQLATLGGGRPHVLTFPVPRPNEAAPAPHSTAPPAPPGHEPKPETHDDGSHETPTSRPPAPNTTTLAAVTSSTTVAELTVTTFVDAHDNDGGERGHDDNGHFTTGPQGGGHDHRR